MRGGLLATANPRSRPSTGGSGGSIPILLHTLYAQYNGLMKADGVELTDATIAAGSNVLNTTTTSFAFSDIGKGIGIRKAGVNHGWLIGTITAVNSAHQAVISASATFAVTNGEACYGTDNSPLFQALINQGFTLHSCKFIFEYGLYLFFGALQNNVIGQAPAALNPNSQHYIPNIPANAADYYGWAAVNGNINRYVGMYIFEGELERRMGVIGSASISYPNQENMHFTGVRFRSMLPFGSGTSPAFFGGLGGSTNNYGFNPNNVIFRNIAIEITPNVTSGGVEYAAICGLNLSLYKTANVQNVAIAPHHFQFHNSAQPPSDIYGLAMPARFDDSTSEAANCEAAGFYSNFVLGEHAYMNRCNSYFAINAFQTIKSFDYPMKMSFCSANSVGTFLGVHSGAVANAIEAKVDLESCYMEASSDLYSFAAGKWWKNTSTINDPGNNLCGDIDITHEMAQAPTGQYMLGLRFIGGDNVEFRLNGNYVLKNVTHTANFAFTELYEYFHKMHTVDSATAVVITIADEADTRRKLPLNHEVPFFQKGAGQIQFAGGNANVILLYPSGVTGSRGINTFCKLRRIAANTWLFVDGT